MRLPTNDITNIKQCLHRLDEQAKVYLFGSRTDDNKKGGDIDLLIISNKIDFIEKLQLKICIKEKIGDQKLDIIISPENKTPFASLAMEAAIQL